MVNNGPFPWHAECYCPVCGVHPWQHHHLCRQACPRAADPRAAPALVLLLGASTRGAGALALGMRARCLAWIRATPRFPGNSACTWSVVWCLWCPWFLRASGWLPSKLRPAVSFLVISFWNENLFPSLGLLFLLSACAVAVGHLHTPILLLSDTWPPLPSIHFSRILQSADFGYNLKAQR